MQHQIDPQSFGPNGAAMAEAVSTCVHCGFCLAACPTYQVLGQEADSPRGRIVLMKDVLEGTLEVEDAASHIDKCLGCLACEPACPSGVAYRDLITPYRAWSSEKRKRGIFDQVSDRLAGWTLPFPKRLRLAAKTSWMARKMAFALPTRMQAMVRLLPHQLPPKQNWDGVHQAIGKRRGRVALLTGCAQSVLAPDINTATIEVLTRNGIEVVVPTTSGKDSQTCCGALSWHLGDQKAASQFARSTLNAFPDDVDAIVTNAAGCGSGMHEYPMILAGTEDQQRAKQFAEKVYDVSAYLFQLGTVHKTISATIDSQTQKSPTKVAYQDACHLASAQGIRDAPRQLLTELDAVELVDIGENHLCCGSAGTYNVDQPEIADQLGKRKAERIIATQADIVASGNIGCLTQLSSHLGQKGSKIAVRHTMQVIRDHI